MKMLQSPFAAARKTFDTSSNAWLELQGYLFGAVFMFAAAYVLQKNGHVGIDAVFANCSDENLRL